MSVTVFSFLIVFDALTLLFEVLIPPNSGELILYF